MQVIEKGVSTVHIRLDDLLPVLVVIGMLHVKDTAVIHRTPTLKAVAPHVPRLKFPHHRRSVSIRSHQRTERIGKPLPHRHDAIVFAPRIDLILIHARAKGILAAQQHSASRHAARRGPSRFEVKALRSQFFQNWRDRLAAIQGIIPRRYVIRQDENDIRTLLRRCIRANGMCGSG